VKEIPISESDKAIWDELDDMSKHFLDPTIPWKPKTRREAAFAFMATADTERFPMIGDWSFKLGTTMTAEVA
jgi:hypothetical protein